MKRFGAFRQLVVWSNVFVCLYLVSTMTSHINNTSHYCCQLQTDKTDKQKQSLSLSIIKIQYVPVFKMEMRPSLIFILINCRYSNVPKKSQAM